MNVNRYIDSLESRRLGKTESPVAELPVMETGQERANAATEEDGSADRPTADHPIDDDSSCGGDDIFEPASSDSLFGLFEMILKDRTRLHRIIRDPGRQARLIPRLLGISLAAFVFFGAAMTVVLLSTGTWPHLTAFADVLNEQMSRAQNFRLYDESRALNLREQGSSRLISFDHMDIAGAAGVTGLLREAAILTAAYALGLIAATGICLPSLYFYGLLSGVKMTMPDVVVHALKAKATAAVALVGILPIYAALSMGIVIFEAGEPLLRATLWLGLILSFIAGLWGTYSLYTGFEGICHTMPPEKQERRECFLRRLVLAWSAVYTAVSPVMIFTLWIWLQSFGEV